MPSYTLPGGTIKFEETKTNGKHVAVAASGGGGSVPDGLNATGTVGHGNTLTITDGDARFGTRTNVKPLYVNLGDGKAGNALGRDTADYFDGTATYQTTIKAGQLAGGVSLDHFGNSDAIFEGLTFDSSKDLIAYTERYRDYDITDPAYWSGTEPTGFNLKPYRVYAADRSSYILQAYQGEDGGVGNPRVGAENVSGGQTEYGGFDTSPFAWFGEELHFQNSSASGVNDGVFNTYRGASQALTDSEENFITFDSDDPGLLVELVLDQVSNGTGQSSPTIVGYMCVDDEYPGVYVGDAADRTSCTVLVRQPQTSWASDQIEIQQVESQVPLSTGYLFVRTDRKTWLNSTGIDLGAL